MDALFDEGIENAVRNGYANDSRSIAVGGRWLRRIASHLLTYRRLSPCVRVQRRYRLSLLDYITDYQGAFGYVWYGRDDLADYLIGKVGFKETSVSAPLISPGIALLILSANPSLS